MIDIENDVYNRVATSVKDKYSNAFVSSEFVRTPAKFPCVTILEMSNSAYTLTQSSGSVENHADVMYEVNVYSNKKTNKKTECKNIMALIDNEFATLGFSRIMLQPIPNMDDATIYRMVARYRAIVSQNSTIYRR